MSNMCQCLWQHCQLSFSQLPRHPHRPCRLHPRRRRRRRCQCHQQEHRKRQQPAAAQRRLSWTSGML